MGKYSIKELEQLSGIKAHTIRIWEKRYKIIEPSRTATNIRFYSDDDLKKIINVSLLNNSGIKISKIVNLSSAEVSKKVVELSDSKTEAALQIDQLVISMIDLDEQKFVKILHTLTKQHGFEQTVIDVIYPFLEKIGILWQSGAINPAQEHFISQLIRQKIIVAIDDLPIPNKNAHAAVLFLPENELHELGLLFYHYLVKKNGYRTWYLGQTAPYVDVKYVCHLHKPTLIISSFTNLLTPLQIQQYVTTLCKDFPETKILISGGGLRKNKLPQKLNLTIFGDAKELRAILTELQAAL